jgi:hypothetical protein
MVQSFANVSQNQLLCKRMLAKTLNSFKYCEAILNFLECKTVIFNYHEQGDWNLKKIIFLNGYFHYKVLDYL